MTTREKTRPLADQYADRLTSVINARVTEMQEDDVSHHLIHRVLGISMQEDQLIDVYGEAAWDYVRDQAAIDLKEILEEIANQRTATAL